MLHHYLLKARLQKEGEHHVGDEMMRKMIELVVFGAKPFFVGMATTSACVLLATFLLAKLQLTVTLWAVLFAASLLSVLGAGVYLHLVRKKQNEGFALPGEIPPEMKRELMPYITMMIGITVVVALMMIFPMVI